MNQVSSNEPSDQVTMTMTKRPNSQLIKQPSNPFNQSTKQPANQSANPPDVTNDQVTNQQ
jgi:hypothetical protein